MNNGFAAAVLILSLATFQTARDATSSRFVLPNAKLLRCGSVDCLQLWPESPDNNNVFPKQVIVDVNQNCIYGMTALYDKSASVDDIKSAINERYAKWVYAGSPNDPVKLWRVEPERFAIQLTVADKQDEKKHWAEAGTKQVIYLAFGGKSACDKQ